jgi:hypothetical protein
MPAKAGSQFLAKGLGPREFTPDLIGGGEERKEADSTDAEAALNSIRAGCARGQRDMRNYGGITWRLPRSERHHGNLRSRPR